MGLLTSWPRTGCGAFIRTRTGQPRESCFRRSRPVHEPSRNRDSLVVTGHRGGTDGHHRVGSEMPSIGAGLAFGVTPFIGGRVPVSRSGRSSGTMHTRPVARAAGRPGCRPRSPPGSLEFGPRFLSTFDACRGQQPMPCSGGAGVSTAFPGARRPDGRSSVALCQAATNSTEAGVGAGSEDRRQSNHRRRSRKWRCSSSRASQ